MFLIFPVQSVVKFWKQKSLFTFSTFIPKFRIGLCTGSVFFGSFFSKKKNACLARHAKYNSRSTHNLQTLPKIILKRIILGLFLQKI